MAGVRHAVQGQWCAAGPCCTDRGSARATPDQGAGQAIRTHSGRPRSSMLSRARSLRDEALRQSRPRFLPRSHNCTGQTGSRLQARGRTKDTRVSAAQPRPRRERSLSERLRRVLAHFRPGRAPCLSSPAASVAPAEQSPPESRRAAPSRRLMPLRPRASTARGKPRLAASGAARPLRAPRRDHAAVLSVEAGLACGLLLPRRRFEGNREGRVETCSSTELT